MTDSVRRRAERVEVRVSRERILAAADALCSSGTRGLTMSELSKAAGIGNATLYRRFPDVESVLRALHERHMEHFAAIARAVGGQPSGWDAVVVTIEGIVDTLIAHPAIPHVYRRLAQVDTGFRLGPEWDGPLRAIVEVAQREGALRPDVDANDVAMAAFRLGEFAHHPEPERGIIVARQLAITIDGLRASSATTALPGQPISTDTVNDLIRREGAAGE